MDHRAIIDVVCKSAVTKLASEIGVLLGQELHCGDVQLRLTSKEAFFTETIREKSALSRMKVSGDQQGESYLLTRIAAAVYLGGTLIMLPADMIEEHSQNGKLEGELEDAFGEVANIIAGVFTQAFVDKYPKTIRFIKTTVEELVPTKIDPANDQPFPPGNYYIASCNLKTDEMDLGPVEFIIPAEIFGLEAAPVAAPSPPKEPSESVAAKPAAQKAPASQPAASGWDTVATQAASPPPATGWDAVANQASSPPPATGWDTVATQAESASAKPPASPPAEQVSSSPESSRPAFADAKKLIDVVFNATIRQLSEEISALIGQDLKCDDIQLLMTSKADFFAHHCKEKTVLAQLKVSGDREGVGFLAVQAPDATILGGTLIMLPEEQIEEQVGKNQFEGEVTDAFGEVANILAGGLTQVFLEHYPKQLRFVKTGMETLEPTKLDLSSDQPFPEGSYYLVSFAIHMDNHDLNRLQFIFPGGLFDLDETQPAAGAAEVAEQSKVVSLPVQEAITPAASKFETEAATSAGSPVVLIISEQPTAAEPFVQILSSAEHSCKVLSYQDDVRQAFQQHQILGVFLVMAQVGEKGFATAIKLQSTGRPLPPLIFAGPDWTRSAVLRAIKYGAKDIIIIPASNDEIQEKVSQYIRKAS